MPARYHAVRRTKKTKKKKTPALNKWCIPSPYHFQRLRKIKEANALEEKAPQQLTRKDLRLMCMDDMYDDMSDASSEANCLSGYHGTYTDGSNGNGIRVVSELKEFLQKYPLAWLDFSFMQSYQHMLDSEVEDMKEELWMMSRFEVEYEDKDKDETESCEY